MKGKPPSIILPALVLLGREPDFFVTSCELTSRSFGIGRSPAVVLNRPLLIDDFKHSKRALISLIDPRSLSQELDHK